MSMLAIRIIHLESMAIRRSRLKPTPAQNHDPIAPNTADTKKDSHEYATVYTFVIWDHDKGTTAIYPRMATRETIARMRGKVNEDTAWVIDSSALDIEGFYSGGESQV